MDWFSTIVGAAIGFISSIGIILVQRGFDRAGKLEIYTKMVYDRISGSHSWGFQNTRDGLFLNVPIWIEIQNLTNSPRILRDINLVLVSNGKELATMRQTNRANIEGEGVHLFANEGSYSLSIDGGQIKQIDCHFLLEANSDRPVFDEILLRYFDEKDRAHKFSLGHVNGDWSIKEFPCDGNWGKLKEKK